MIVFPVFLIPIHETSLLSCPACLSEIGETGEMPIPELIKLCILLLD